MDSLTPQAREWATALGTSITVNSNQESTDFQKCIDFIATNYLPTHQSHQAHQPNQLGQPRLHAAPDILVLGGLGGRVDQSISILHYLYKGPKLYSQGRIYLLTTSAITFLLPAGEHRINVRDSIDTTKRLGKHVGILPLLGPTIISTEGLRWDVKDWETVIGGMLSTSNHVREDVCTVKTNKDVLFTIDLREDE